MKSNNGDNDFAYFYQNYEERRNEKG